ncbi:MAG TPA: hypothetical protein VE986_06145 [Hyphomicrobiales bacterium]|nr:hypothetical protein [Hyphomicrobiales bacterium]
MRYAIMAAAFAAAVSYGTAAHAAPTDFGALKLEASKDSAIQKVWHCRYWSGGWGCGRYRWR